MYIATFFYPQISLVKTQQYNEGIFCILYVFFSLKVLKPEEKQRLAENIANHVCNASEFLQKRVIHNFGQADPEYGQRIKQILDKILAKRSAKRVNVGRLAKKINHFKVFKLGWFLVFNATFNNILVISWRLVLMVEETGVPRENSQPVARQHYTDAR